MFITRKIAAVALLASMSVAPASAQDGRYVMEKTGDGYLRMDTASGEMSMCKGQNGQMVCKLAADERAAFHDALDELEARVARLEAMVAGGVPARGLPSDDEIDRGLDTMEKFFDRFMGIIDKFEDEEPAPDRT